MDNPEINPSSRTRSALLLIALVVAVAGVAGVVGYNLHPRSVGMSASGEPAHTVVSSAYSTCSFPMTPDQPTGAFVDDPNKAWVCNSEDGILKMTLNDFPVTKINALTSSPP